MLLTKKSSKIYSSALFLEFTLQLKGGIMKKRRNEYLSEFVTNQYPLEIFKEMIFIILDMVEMFNEELSDITQNQRLTQSYETHSNSPCGSFNSQIETIVIGQYDTWQKKQEFINRYNNVLSSLLPLEYDVFQCIYINGFDNLVAMEELSLYSNQLNKIKKSATVRFCQRLGLEKFTSIFTSDKQLNKGR